jgi:hypothetical protein
MAIPAFAEDQVRPPSWVQYTVNRCGRVNLSVTIHSCSVSTALYKFRLLREVTDRAAAQCRRNNLASWNGLTYMTWQDGNRGAI